MIITKTPVRVSLCFEWSEDSGLSVDVFDISGGDCLQHLETLTKPGIPDGCTTLCCSPSGIRFPLRDVRPLLPVAFCG